MGWRRTVLASSVGNGARLSQFIEGRNHACCRTTSATGVFGVSTPEGLLTTHIDAIGICIIARKPQQHSRSVPPGSSERLLLENAAAAGDPLGWFVGNADKCPWGVPSRRLRTPESDQEREGGLS